MKFYYVLILVLIHNVWSKESEKQQWKKFKMQNKKSYTSEEEQRRFDIFKDNLRKINEHNVKYEKGLSTYQMEVNKFADLTSEEYCDIYNMYPSKTFLYNDTLPRPNNTDVEDDDSDYLDWREKGAVTHVKYQGTCGACWIFSTIGVLESYYFRKYKKLISFSEQNVIDCLSKRTCKGGWPPKVFDYVKRYGAVREEDYPFEEKEGQCRRNKTTIQISFEEIVQIHNSEEKLKEAVTNFGPVVVCAYASSNWMFYKSGVWYERECSDMSNHAMVLVGYGKENGVDYWLLKNSMGSDWGEDGYIKIARNKHHNYCGLTETSFYLK